MNEQKSLYRTPPAQKVFEELRQACISIAKSDDSYGDKELWKLKILENVDSNFMWMIERFDIQHHREMANSGMVGVLTKSEIKARMLERGIPDKEIMF